MMMVSPGNIWLSSTGQKAHFLPEAWRETGWDEHLHDLLAFEYLLTLS